MNIGKRQNILHMGTASTAMQWMTHNRVENTNLLVSINGLYCDCCDKSVVTNKVQPSIIRYKSII